MFPENKKKRTQQLCQTLLKCFSDHSLKKKLHTKTLTLNLPDVYLLNTMTSRMILTKEHWPLWKYCFSNLLCTSISSYRWYLKPHVFFLLFTVKVKYTYLGNFVRIVVPQRRLCFQSKLDIDDMRFVI